MLKFFNRPCAALLLAVLLALAVPARAQYSKGVKSFGPRVGYVSRNTSACAGLEFQIALSSRVRLAPEALIVFRNNDRDALMVGCDVQFPLPFAGGKAAFYPLVGLEYMSWSLHNTDHELDKDVTTHSNRFGPNAGVGIELNCTSSLKLSVEARYTLVEKYSTAVVSAGIAYLF